ncbi:Hypothetical protein Cp262_1600 [Corynebacterium pseudotuberculosis]|uniref:thiopeptide-type bacteriocin biosynthesis protein n=1 Tax=Corynebacterium pseudotuberculosis TaxID=1719 RepID=UPI00065E6C7D|nr:thiopeptide-type bacteriocin biosynthesis protein [Corynebacterium pseudotuberculosis]AKP09249.1 Hypothetical protein Cp262_1600 [Corynebacterium pseudotuberculosis]
MRTTDPWLAFHIFYGEDPSHLLRDCLLPFAHACVAEGLVRRFFHMNYWLEGAHVRLRLELSSPADRERVIYKAHHAIQPWIDAHPSSAPQLSLRNPEGYRRLFEHEYPMSRFSDYIDQDGLPRLQPDNCIRERYYEREYDRYGGPTGMSLSQDIFQASTLFVEKLLRSGVVEARTSRLATAALGMVCTAHTFLSSDESISIFWESYHRGWTSSFSIPTSYTSPAAQQKIAAEAQALSRAVTPFRDALHRYPDGSSLPEPYATFTRHMASVVEKLHAAHAAQELDFGDSVAEAGHTWKENSTFLLRSYVHMTNNRMSVNISDESYLAYLLQKLYRETP